MEKKILTKKDLRKFGFLVGGIFIVLFGIILPILKNRGFVPWPYIVAVCFILPALVYPMSLKYVYKIWMRIGHILGFVNTRIIAAIMFVFIFTPVGLFMRLIRRDILDRKLDQGRTSYRTAVEGYDAKHMERPF